jgi:hypothetical protein
MSSDRLLEEFPESDDDLGIPRSGKTASGNPGRKPAGKQPNRLQAAWDHLIHLGLRESALRLGTHLLVIILLLGVIWSLRAFYVYIQENRVQIAPEEKAVFAAALPSPTPTAPAPALPSYIPTSTPYQFGIPRLALIHTTIPARPRTEVISYIVQVGDTIFGIAEQFGLKPESIMWGNTYIFGDDPHNLKPEQELIILPVDGTYHKWSAGEGLNGVAQGYGVAPEDIINWPGNHLDPTTLGNWSNPNIEPGTMLVVPGGERAFITWSAPRISRENPGVARLLGEGFCGTVVDGAVGIGSFIWPSNNHFLSGYDYSPSTNHYGIDVAGELGDPLYAADNGVVVYSGWNNRGYGNVVVIDHGNGWQTLYAHMSVIAVGCGQSVYQGGYIGAFGSTGNSSGPHLHFEMLHESYGKVNPWNFLPPP